MKHELRRKLLCETIGRIERAETGLDELRLGLPKHANNDALLAAQLELLSIRHTLRILETEGN